MKRLAVLAIAFLIALVAVGPEQASSHALLSRAEPPINAQVREPPSLLTLYFSEPLERRFSTVRVTNQQNERLDERVEFDDSDGTVMRVYLKTVRPNYLTVSWETVSTVDGHRITGSYPLTVLEADGKLPVGTPPAPATLTEGAAADPLRLVTRLVLLVAGCVFTGAMEFVAVVIPSLPGDAGARVRDRFNRLALGLGFGSLVALAAAGGIELLLQASEIGAGAGDVLDTRWGERWLWRTVVLAPAAVAVMAAFSSSRFARPGAALGLLAGVAYLAITSSVSHAAAGEGSFWATGSDFVHLLATSVWLGSLGLVIVFFLRAQRDLPDAERYAVLATVLQRFSSLAVASVALLLLTGAFNSVVQVAEPADLLDTGYGNALLVKLLLLLPLLFAGAANAYLFRPDLVDEADSTGGGKARLDRLASAEQQLRETMRWELGLAMLVLAVVALLVQLTPTRGRIEPGESQGVFIGSKDGGGIFATLQIEPRQAGNNTFSVYMAGAVEDVQSVRLNFWPGGDSGQESRLILEASNPPTFYLGQGANLGQAGEWEVQVFIRRTAGTGPDLTLPFTLEVPPPGGVVAVEKPGGPFDLPLTFSAGSVAVLVLAAAVSGGVVFVSLRRPGLSGGYGTLAAEQVAARLPAIRPAWSLVVLMVIGVGLGLWIGAHRHAALNDTAAKAGNPVEATTESIARGQMLFATNCTQCHGETGRGDGPLAASLTLKPANLYDHIPYHPDQFFFSVLTSGVGGVMPAFGNSMSEEDRWNILNYLRATFKEEPASR